MDKTRRRQPWRLALVFLGMLAFASLACNNGQPTASKDRTRRMTPVVQAGSPATNPPTLHDDNWKDLNKGDAVRTSTSGQAELQLVECTGSLYLFIDGGITVSTCQWEEKGLATCLQQGTAGFNVDCAQRFVVDTYAGQVIVSGTAFSVTYLPERRLLLVIVFAGRVEVRPVLNFATGELAPWTILVNADQFLYTMPGPESPQLLDLPARQALPLERLPPLVQELQIMPWMDEVDGWAERERILPVDWPFRKPELTVAILSAGGPLADPRVQEAMLFALDKERALKSAFPGQQVRFVAALQEADVDAFSRPHDPQTARKLLDEADYPDGLVVTLLYPTGAEPLAIMAEVISADLQQAGIEVKAEAQPAERIAAFAQRIAGAGRPVLWLQRR